MPMPLPTGSLTQSIGRFTADLDAERIPAEGRRRAVASILDAVGCTLAGSCSPEAEPVRRLVEADGGTPIASILGHGTRVPAAAAALANGTAGHALDYDDSSPPMIGHPSVVLSAALFALAERENATGAAIVTAYVCGLEVAARLGRHLNPSHYAAGWHATATLGTLAAAVASAKLLGLDADGVRTAIGIAASSAGGVRKNFGSMVKPLHAGLAARNGVLAADLARLGHTADGDALDGERGFLDVFSGEAKVDAAAIRFGGDQALEIVASGVGIKRYACCGCTHSALDALLEIRGKHGLDPAAVESIDITMNSLVPDILVHHRPRTPAQAKFSMEYCLAVGLVDGDCGIAQFGEERVADPVVQDLLTRVTLRVDPAIAYRNGVYPGTVTLTLTDGRRLSASAEEAKGHPDKPLALVELRAKFLDCARVTLPRERAEASYDALAGLDSPAPLRLLMATLGSPSGTSFSQGNRS